MYTYTRALLEARDQRRKPSSAILYLFSLEAGSLPELVAVLSTLAGSKPQHCSAFPGLQPEVSGMCQHSQLLTRCLGAEDPNSDFHAYRARP